MGKLGALIGVGIALTALFMGTFLIAGWLALYSVYPLFAILCLVIVCVGGYVGSKHFKP